MVIQRGIELSGGHHEAMTGQGFHAIAGEVWHYHGLGLGSGEGKGETGTPRGFHHGASSTRAFATSSRVSMTRLAPKRWGSVVAAVMKSCSSGTAS